MYILLCPNSNVVECSDESAMEMRVHFLLCQLCMSLTTLTNCTS